MALVVCTVPCASAALCCVLSPFASVAAMVGHHVHQLMKNYAAIVAADPTNMQSIGSPVVNNLAATVSALNVLVWLL